jgi:sporulation protein YlmC with PRC-barrel domain
MKYTSNSNALCWTRPLAAILLSFAIGIPVDASEHKGEDATFKAVRASNVVGDDVLDADGKKVGEVADFVVTFGELGRVTHVVLGQGLFPSFGDNLRLVPAELIMRKDEHYRLKVPGKAVMETKSFSGDYSEVLNEYGILAKIDKAHGLDNGDVEKPHYAYRNLDEDEIGTTDGRQLGYVIDMMVSLRREISPYLLMNTTDPILGPNLTSYYAIPTSKIKERNPGSYTELVTTLTVDELMETETSESTEAILVRNNQRGLVFKYKEDS